MPHPKQGNPVTSLNEQSVGSAENGKNRAAERATTPSPSSATRIVREGRGMDASNRNTIQPSAEPMANTRIATEAAINPTHRQKGTRTAAMLRPRLIWWMRE